MSKFNILLDILAGSCGKGAISPRLSELYGFTSVSCHNFPNAGHTARLRDSKFVGKAVPTPLIRQKWDGTPMTGFISPGSGFDPLQLFKEWIECGQPNIIIHNRASLVLPRHAARERDGKESTKHLASTMQGCAAAASDKIMRLPTVVLANQLQSAFHQLTERLRPTSDEIRLHEQFFDAVSIVDGQMFRDLTFDAVKSKGMLHEGSQGYALSIDHGLDYPYVTSRNCDTAQAMSYMAIPPQLVGDVWGVMRAGHSIRVGNVVEDGKTVGNSGGGYPDCQEISWRELGTRAHMPNNEIDDLSKRELTTVTGRLRKVFTESPMGITDAIRTCGITKLVVNFIQYINWEDAGVRKFEELSNVSRAYIDGVETRYQRPVVMVGSGADHYDFIMR